MFRWLAYATLALVLWQVAHGAVNSAYAQAAVPVNRPVSAEALLDRQPDALIEELMEERLVLLERDGVAQKGLVEALVIFLQPRERVWQLLLQRERQKEYRPELTSIAVLEQAEDRAVEEQRLRIAFLAVEFRLQDQFDRPTRTLTWQLDPTFESPLEHVSGYWELHALDGGRTLARFGTKVSVSPIVPGFLQSRITRNNVPAALENTRRWVDSDGHWRP